MSSALFHDNTVGFPSTRSFIYYLLLTCLSDCIVVGKIEYMNEESNVILSTAGIPGNITRYIEDVRTGSIREVEQDRVSGRVDYKTYYQNIPSIIISQLRDIYQSDLDILGYPDSPL